jgi:hypothetical protein
MSAAALCRSAAFAEVVSSALALALRLASFSLASLRSRCLRRFSVCLLPVPALLRAGCRCAVRCCSGWSSCGGHGWAVMYGARSVGRGGRHLPPSPSGRANPSSESWSALRAGLGAADDCSAGSFWRRTTMRGGLGSAGLLSLVGATASIVAAPAVVGAAAVLAVSRLWVAMITRTICLVMHGSALQVASGCLQ